MNKTTLLILSLLVISAFAIGCKKAEETKVSAPAPAAPTQAAPAQAPEQKPVETPPPAPSQEKKKVKTPSASMPKQKPIESQAAAPAPEKRGSRLTAPAPELTPKKPTETRAIIETKFGNIELRFFPDAAPNHVKNFIELAKKGFYDGTTFHRVIPGFMIQGGDPNTKDPDKSKHGMGGPGYKIKAEFNAKPHKKGTLSAARAADPDSAGSQFFICVANTPFLDGQYTVFGEVVSGIEVVDKIVNQPRDNRDNPNERIEMKVGVTEK